ncbi:hypothetical protein Droror1_Dr00019877 [Drosera rotundifolia]
MNTREESDSKHISTPRSRHENTRSRKGQNVSFSTSGSAAREDFIKFTMKDSPCQNANTPITYRNPHRTRQLVEKIKPAARRKKPEELLVESSISGKTPNRLTSSNNPSNKTIHRSQPLLALIIRPLDH